MPGARRRLLPTSLGADRERRPLGWLERGLIREAGPGRGAFRHALTREALYADVPWLQRRALHRRMAELLQARGGRCSEVAIHWLGARDGPRAREALLRAAEESRVVHAYRDAARAGRQALELWPEGDERERRLEALETYATSAELSGELAEAARAWREVCALCAGTDAPVRRAGAHRRLAAVHDLTGDRESALAARRAAAEAYGLAGRPADAATEHLAMGNYLRSRADYSGTIALARAAGEEADLAERLDLRARALGLEGVALAKGGDHSSGLEIVRAGLTLALEHGLTPVAAELYQRLSLVIYDAGEYRLAQEALETALDLCRTGEQRALEVTCVTCMIYVLRECGEWPRALAMGQELIVRDTAVWVAEGLIGAIHGFQGKLSSARRLLCSSLAAATQIGHFNMAVDCLTGLAWVAAAAGAADEAADRCRALLAHWERSEDHHYEAGRVRRRLPKPG